ncbi:MAG TPA: prepilin-type N-terminal cleavage/methylation domain-containing protein, partial [Accumulibacter sp.]|nr:prepilin-type N-terminal cleavage/methylation domain-containing protein [Accumulibacter sp.]
MLGAASPADTCRSGDFLPGTKLDSVNATERPLHSLEGVQLMKKLQKGFTLIELMIVVAIIG